MLRKEVLLVKANGENYLVERTKLNQSKMQKGMEYYDGNGNIRIWGTGNVHAIDSRRIVATPDQLGIIEESQEGNHTSVRDMVEADFAIIFNRGGECYVEVDGLPYPDGVSRPIYIQHKVFIHIQ